MEEIKTFKTIDEIKTFSDPYRLQILNCFYNFKEPATVKQIADEMGEVPAKIYYHVKKMEKCDIVRLIYTREINGIIAKYYEPSAKRFDIGRSDIDESIQKVALNETQTMVESIYNESLKVFLDTIGSGGYSKRGSISMENIYLTDEEHELFLKYIEDFCNKHNGRKKSNDDTHEYSFFSTIIKK